MPLTPQTTPMYCTMGTTPGAKQRFFVKHLVFFMVLRAHGRHIMAVPLVVFGGCLQDFLIETPTFGNTTFDDRGFEERARWKIAEARGRARARSLLGGQVTLFHLSQNHCWHGFWSYVWRRWTAIPMSCMFST